MRLCMLLGMLLMSFHSYAQVVATLPDIKNVASGVIIDPTLQREFNTNLEDHVDSLQAHPEYHSTVWKFIIGRIFKNDSSAGRWLNAFDIDFKTFQNDDSTQASLGFSYNLNLERAWVREHNSHRTGMSFALSTQGNVAFRKEVNPNNFLVSKLSFGQFHIGGGVFIKDKTKSDEELFELRRKLTTMPIEAIRNSKEWKAINERLGLKNSWIFRYDVNAGIESNQDFSRRQYTFGLRVGGGIKSWNANDLLSRLNVLDYPFALLRSLTRFENERGVKLYGSTMPILLAGLDYVNPEKDTLRESLAGELKPFPRVNLEIGFRTIVGKAGEQTLFFNSSLRFYQELSASTAITAAQLDRFRYFTASITSSNGLFISYTYGQLPFDRKDEQVYQLGFTYTL